jgi:hypothetical protein
MILRQEFPRQMKRTLGFDMRLTQYVCPRIEQIADFRKTAAAFPLPGGSSRSTP